MAEKAETEPNIAHFTRFIADEEMGKEVRFFFSRSRTDADPQGPRIFHII
jgi:hypothetical protein